MNIAPIALFVYNRPEHTRQTVNALLKNDLAEESDLIIFSDAPKNPEAAEAVREVRTYVRSISGFRSVSIVERETNWGLAKSLIEGVTSVVNSHGRVIVMEDDLVTSPYFLGFMNAALNVYQYDEKVMHISGYMFPIDNAGIPETFFLRTASCWGWATWDRAWRHFEKNPKKLLSDFTRQTIRRFNMDGTYDFWAQVEQNEQGLIDTWAVFWYAAVFQKGGLCLHPKFSMVNNIGHDNSGLHCDETNTFSVQLASKPVTHFEHNIVEDALALSRTQAFLSPTKPALSTRLLRLFRKCLNLGSPTS